MFPLLFAADAPYFSTRIICDEERSILKDSNTYRPSVYFLALLGGNETRYKVFHRAARLTVLEWDEDDSIPCEFRSVPRPVLANERSVAVAFGEHRPAIEGET